AEFDGACFKGEAVFERLNVGRNLFCRSFNYGGKLFPIEFQATARFLGCRVEGDAEFRGAAFTAAERPFRAEDLKDTNRLAAKLRGGDGPVSAYLRGKLPPASLRQLGGD